VPSQKECAIARYDLRLLGGLKICLRHEEKGRAYVYRAVESARSLAPRAVRQIIDSFCRGSVKELVSGMAEAKILSKGEMDTLEEFVPSRKGGK